MDVSDVSSIDQRANWGASASTRTGDAVKAGTGTSNAPKTGNAPLAVQGLQRDVAPTYMAQWANPRLMRPEAHIQLGNIWDRLQACLEAMAKRLLGSSMKSSTSEDLLANELWKREQNEDADQESEEDDEHSGTEYHGYVALESMTAQGAQHDEWVESVADSVQKMLSTYCRQIHREPEG